MVVVVVSKTALGGNQYRLTIPGRLPGQNEINVANRAHRYTGAKQKFEAENYVLVYIRQQLRQLQITRKVWLTLTFWEPNRLRDKDNVIGGGLKVIADALVAAQVLPGDGWQWVDGYTPYVEHDPISPRIEVVIRELEGL